MTHHHAESTTSKPWEQIDNAELEARLEAARRLRRDELLPWLAGAWRGLVGALSGPGARDHGGAHHRHSA